MRVLLIEDDSATAQSIELMLKSESFNVYTTDLGEEGVDLGKLYDYDIILLDLNLPDMSGYEVLRTLRLSKVKTPILILSGMAGIEDKVRGVGFAADPHSFGRAWFPCFDNFVERCTFEFFVHVDNDRTVFANGALVDVSEPGPGEHIYH